LLDLKASLRRDQRRFEEALRLLRRAVELFTSLGERHRAGRSLVGLSIVFNQMGKALEAIPVLQRAIKLVDPEREPRLLLCARHNLAAYTASAGRFLEAQKTYQEARSLYRSFNEAWIQNRRKWLKGQISLGLGHLRQAESLFLAARDGFIAEGIPYDTALVSLELALLYAEQGRTEDLKRLTAEMVPIFASRHIHREALAALTFFRQAVDAERAGAELVAKVAAYLRRAEGDPGLPFEAGNGTS
ncbi:MAG: tetratricopeptide repeat protein, partial [Thermoanaerobaculia bacterium]